MTRFLAGLAAGLLVGNILSEATRTGLGLLMPDSIDPTLWLGPNAPDSLSLLLSIGLWLLATASSAAMASAISANPLAGWLCALCWALAMLLTAALSGISPAVVTIALGMVVAGTLLGNRIARDCARSTPDAAG